jgi:hypothetical protein
MVPVADPHRGPGARPGHPERGDPQRVGRARRLRSGGHRLGLGQRSGEVVDDLPGDDLGRRQVVDVLERGVLQPGDVEVGLVTRDEFLVREPAEALALLALVTATRPAGLDEFVEVCAAQRVLLRVKC